MSSLPKVQDSNRGAVVILALIGGYIGIYLCRKNLAVATPFLQDAFHASRSDVGWIASVGNLAYALGKLTSGPLIERVGGRMGLLVAMAAVAIFGGAAAFAPSLGIIAICYSLNRVAGAGGWGAMLKLVPSWYSPARIGTVTAVLSLSYVFGGIAANIVGQQVVARGGDWHAIFWVPALALCGITIGCALLVRSGPLTQSRSTKTARSWAAIRADIWGLLRRPQFLLVCAMSFTLTLMRESFNTWSVDFLTSVQSGAKSVGAAALGSTTFDLAGALSILGMGVVYDRTPPGQRRWIIFGVLALLTGVLLALPSAGAASPIAASALIGGVGLLVYGPYSLLAGALALETGGAALAATAAGLIDAIGYVAGILSGKVLGGILDLGGYALGFRCLAGVTAVASLLALAMRPTPRSEP